MIRVLVCIIVLISAQAPFCYSADFGVARHATPVLNSPDFSTIFGGKNGSGLKTDRCGQVRELEFIALPGTAFKIIGEHIRNSITIYQVETEEYLPQPGIRLYVESRFIALQENSPAARQRNLPELGQILAALKESVGSPYVWGGNVQQGIPEIWQYFNKGIADTGKKHLILAGLDCSGLLYQATNGWTPRNTSQLISFGRSVPVKGKSLHEIAKLLKPLDLIVWNGHVIMVLDSNTVIESRLVCGKPGNGGVITTSLQKRLNEIMRTRKPADEWPNFRNQKNAFVVRRWFGF